MECGPRGRELRSDGTKQHEWPGHEKGARGHNDVEETLVHRTHAWRWSHEYNLDVANGFCNCFGTAHFPHPTPPTVMTSRCRGLIVCVLWAALLAVVSRAASEASSPTAGLVGAGDIASCSSTGHEATAAFLDRSPGGVITLRDKADPDGSGADLRRCYVP